MSIFSKLIPSKKSVTPKETVAAKDTNEPKEKPFEDGLVSTKDVIAPAALEIDTDFTRMSGKYYRTVFSIINRRFVEVGWLSSLINFDASQTVAMYIYPSDGKQVLDDLRRKITEMEAEISTDIQRGRVINPSTQAKLEDALNLQADLVKGEERFYQFGLYITIQSNDKDELDKVTKNLEAAMGSLMVLTKRTSYQAEEGFITTLPLCRDEINVTRNMDTTSLATTFPFVSSDLSDDKGVMYGINEHNGSLIIFDRFSMPNYNSVVFATAGAGKSYLIKLEALRSLMLGADIIVIDPENEYRDLCEAVGGQYIAFGYGEDSKINPFDMSLVGDDGENAMNSKILNLHKMFKIMIGDMDPIEESILDRAVMDAYKMKGITPDPETQTREPPLIEDLYKSLIGMEEQKAQMLAARVEKYIKGSFAGIFNQKTTVNLKSNFVVFGIKNLEDALRPMAMHIILDYIWTVVKKQLRKRILVVDEAWYLMQFPDSASFLRGIVKRGRKYYLAVTTITQDVDDFLDTPYGKEIVTNSSIQILLKQHSAAIDRLGDVFYLSEGEKQLLLSADKGEGIFFAGQNHVAIRVVASESEHKLITSNPEEVMRLKQQKITLAQEIKEEKLGKKENLVPLEDDKTEINNETIVNQTEPIERKLPETDIISTQEPVTDTVIQQNELKEDKLPETDLIPTQVPTPDVVLQQNQSKENSKPLEEIKNESETVTETISSQSEPIDNKLPEINSIPTQPEILNTDTTQTQTIVPNSEENKPKVLFSAEVIKPEDELQKKIEELEIIEKNKISELQQKAEKEKQKIEDQQKVNKLPSYQELFKSNKLPDFSEPTKNDAFKTEVIQKNNDQQIKKPLFINKIEEKKIPQPPQLAKKQENTGVTTNISAPTKPSTDKVKMDYDALFGNNSDKN